MENFYQTLELDVNATFEDIKQSYQRLILIYHPDKYDPNVDNNQKQHKFYKIQKAWETLRDETKRKQYKINLDGELNINNI